MFIKDLYEAEFLEITHKKQEPIPTTKRKESDLEKGGYIDLSIFEMALGITSGVKDIETRKRFEAMDKDSFE